MYEVELCETKTCVNQKRVRASAISIVLRYTPGTSYDTSTAYHLSYVRVCPGACASGMGCALVSSKLQKLACGNWTSGGTIQVQQQFRRRYVSYTIRAQSTD